MQLRGVISAEPVSELGYGIPNAGDGLNRAGNRYFEPEVFAYLYEEIIVGLSVENPYRSSVIYTPYALGAFANTAGSHCQGGGPILWTTVDDTYADGGHPWFQSS